jgi:hypothetical protein
MRAGRNLSYEAEGGSWRKVLIYLDENDLIQLVRDKKVDGWRVEFVGEARQLALLNDQNEPMPVMTQYLILQAYADVLAWTQVYSEGGASKEYAGQKIREALGRAAGLRV